MELNENQLKVAVGPKRSTNRKLKEITMIECTKTVIFQLLQPLGISYLAKREIIQWPIKNEFIFKQKQLREQ